MKSFIERFIEELDDNLNDPRTSVRLSGEDKLRLLQTVEKQVWERLLTAGGQESMPGIAEATITLSNDTPYYLLPGNFRQFLGFEYRLDGDRRNIQDKLASIHHYERNVDRGVEILDSAKGMIVHPTPRLTADQDWTLIYQKGPVVLHYATAEAAGDNNLIGAEPASSDAGELIKVDDYYVGSMIRIYDADTGTPQTREVTGYSAAAKSFQIRHNWSPTPKGTVKYEIVPLLPQDYDSLYALDGALRVLARRGKSGQRRDLVFERGELWNACKNYFLSNVADRGPTRTTPYPEDEPDTGYEPPFTTL